MVKGWRSGRVPYLALGLVGQADLLGGLRQQHHQLGLLLQLPPQGAAQAVLQGGQHLPQPGLVGSVQQGVHQQPAAAAGTDRHTNETDFGEDFWGSKRCAEALRLFRHLNYN